MKHLLLIVLLFLVANVNWAQGLTQEAYKIARDIESKFYKFTPRQKVAIRKALQDVKKAVNGESYTVSHGSDQTIYQCSCFENDGNAYLSKTYMNQHGGILRTETVERWTDRYSTAFNFKNCRAWLAEDKSPECSGRALFWPEVNTPYIFEGSVYSSSGELISFYFEGPTLMQILRQCEDFVASSDVTWSWASSYKVSINGSPIKEYGHSYYVSSGNNLPSYDMNGSKFCSALTYREQL